MSNLSVENLFVIGPTGKDTYKAQVEELVHGILSENELDVNSTDVYQILSDLGYEIADLSNPDVVDNVATRIAQAVIKLIQEKKKLQANDENKNGESYHKFCAAIDTTCAVSLGVRAKLQQVDPNIEFIELPNLQSKN